LRCNIALLPCSIPGAAARLWTQIILMVEGAMTFRISTRLKDGTPAVLRALRPDDEARLREGIAQLSDRSRYFRFFTGARHLPDHVVKRLVDVDGKRHIAWTGLDLDAPGGPAAIGAVHAMREDDSEQAELAFGILDAYHGQGLARMLLATVIHDCLACGITSLRADVLSTNHNAQRLVRHIGAVLHHADGPVSTYLMASEDADTRLRAMVQPEGLADVYRALDAHARRAA